MVTDEIEKYEIHNYKKIQTYITRDGVGTKTLATTTRGLQTLFVLLVCPQAHHGTEVMKYTKIQDTNI